MSARHKAIVEAVNESMRAMDIEGFLAYCADDFVWTIVGETPIRGKDALRTLMADEPTEAPAFAVHTMVAEGDVVVAQGDMTMKESGRDVPYAFCDVWRFRGDMLVGLESYVVKTARAAHAAAGGTTADGAATAGAADAAGSSR
jgi:ketosteroid isomerase-like protein